MFQMKKKNLFIIGNGFDRWQNLPTSYNEFRKFYIKNIEGIAKELNIKADRTPEGNLITPVEKVYGDIFNPDRLPDEFFWTFEASLAHLDDQSLNLYFGKTSHGLYQLQETVERAQTILQCAFSRWIQSMIIASADSGYRFGNDSYFISFNYTDTLQHRFHVLNDDVEYIHGDATDAESIVFGHTTHPELPFSELMKQDFIINLKGGKSKRLQGLYLVESALYETDKHVQDNIDDLCEFMALADVHIEDFENIYVLGFSFSETDYEYIEFLVKATQKGCDFNTLSFLWKAQQLGLEKLDEESLLEDIQLNIAYAVNHRKRALGKSDMSFPAEEKMERAIFGRSNIYTDRHGNAHDKAENEQEAKEAVNRRFTVEQGMRTKEVIEELCALKDVTALPADCLSVLRAASYIDGGHRERPEDAKWHISYYSEADKKRIENVMRRTGCKEFQLYPSIDECIAEFRTAK